MPDTLFAAIVSNTTGLSCIDSEQGPLITVKGLTLYPDAQKSVASLSPEQHYSGRVHTLPLPGWFSKRPFKTIIFRPHPMISLIRLKNSGVKAFNSIEGPSLQITFSSLFTSKNKEQLNKNNQFFNCHFNLDKSGSLKISMVLKKKPSIKRASIKKPSFKSVSIKKPFIKRSNIKKPVLTDEQVKRSMFNLIRAKQGVQPQRKSLSRSLKKLKPSFFKNPVYKMDLAEILHKSGHTQVAARIMKKMVFSHVHPSFRERAFESLLNMRARFVPSAGVDFNGIDPDDRDDRSVTFSAVGLTSENTSVGVTQSLYSLYRSNTPPAPAYKKNFRETEVKVSHRTLKNSIITGSVTFPHSHNSGNDPYGLSYERTFNNDLSVLGSIQKKKIWKEPFEAFDNNGTSDKYELQLFKPLRDRWFSSAGLSYEDLFLNSRSKAAYSKSANFTIGRVLRKNPYGWHSPLREFSAYITWERLLTVQNTWSQALVDLIDSSSMVRLGFRLHYLYSAKSFLDIELYNAHDDSRGYDFSNFDLYGISAHYHRMISENSQFYIKGEYNTESTTDAQGGKYRRFSAGFRRFF